MVFFLSFFRVDPSFSRAAFPSPDLSALARVLFNFDIFIISRLRFLKLSDPASSPEFNLRLCAAKRSLRFKSFIAHKFKISNVDGEYCLHFVAYFSSIRSMRLSQSIHMSVWFCHALLETDSIQTGSTVRVWDVDHDYEYLTRTYIVK